MCSFDLWGFQRVPSTLTLLFCECFEISPKGLYFESKMSQITDLLSSASGGYSLTKTPKLPKYHKRYFDRARKQYFLSELRKMLGYSFDVEFYKLLFYQGFNTRTTLSRLPKPSLWYGLTFLYKIYHIEPQSGTTLNERSLKWLQ